MCIFTPPPVSNASKLGGGELSPHQPCPSSFRQQPFVPRVYLGSPFAHPSFDPPHPSVNPIILPTTSTHSIELVGSAYTGSVKVLSAHCGGVMTEQGSEQQLRANDEGRLNYKLPRTMYIRRESITTTVGCVLIKRLLCCCFRRSYIPVRVSGDGNPLPILGEITVWTGTRAGDRVAQGALAYGKLAY